MRIIFFLVFVCLSLFARSEISVFDGQDENMQRELQKLPKEEQQIYQNIAPSDENSDFDSNIYDPFIPQSSLVLTTDDYVNKVYVGEVFPIVLHAKTTEDTNFDFNITLQKSKDLIFLNPDLKWEYIKGDYRAVLWFEAKTSNANLEQISVSLLRNGKIFQSASISIGAIHFENTPNNKNFSHLVASSLEVKKIKTSYFDDSSIITMIELSATNANLKSFFVDGVEKQGIENLKGDFNSSNAFYYAIFPSTKTDFEFSYFNKDTKKVENMNFKLKISDDEVSTQSDLNPTNRDFNIYKQYALWVLTLVLALIFVWKKNYFILAGALLCFILSFLVDTHTENATLKSGSRAKILPTESSTYFYTASSNEKVEILSKRLHYVKVLFRDGKIGWVESSDLQKN
ncbi:SH3 domain-containing protein [Campylobacter coli]|nr:hypothetical protein [Campylobacter coli]MBM3089120.1 SH3 domain-containing protein [Campylobacter coli]HED0508215.1 SH3 domain-containing protein [Campylobacter coli]HED0651973.1 SH3 domain-containing protein [Campylobacter coli]HED4392064.1 SH3 domain-containing protein [Campylobacter coli]